MSTPTTNLSLNKPAVGGDDDVWGSLTNDNWDTLDTLIFSIQQAILPIGGILLWTGTVATIPAGFGLCDGSSYTRSDGNGSVSSPDLRSQFVVGSSGDGTGNYPTNTSGGGAGVGTIPVTVAPTSLTEAQLPPHDHGGVVTASRTTSGEGAGIFNAGSGVTEVYTTGKTNSGDGASASHGHAGSTVDLSAVDIDPAWYALAYIMKI